MMALLIAVLAVLSIALLTSATLSERRLRVARAALINEAAQLARQARTLREFEQRIGADLNARLAGALLELATAGERLLAVGLGEERRIDEAAGRVRALILERVEPAAAALERQHLELVTLSDRIAAEMKNYQAMIEQRLATAIEAFDRLALGGPAA